MNKKILSWLLCGCIALACALGVWLMFSGGKPGADEVKNEALPDSRSLLHWTDLTQKVAGAGSSQTAKGTESSAGTEKTVPALPPLIARFANEAIPVETRMAEIKMLAEQADPESLTTLMEIGNSEIPLNHAAVEALGSIASPEVERYLEEKTRAADPHVLAAAVSSIAKVEGEKAVALITNLLVTNRQRQDSRQDVVCRACVQALGTIRSPDAVPALSEELEHTVGKRYHHDYGSMVVAAIKTLNDRRAVPALEAYEKRLRSEIESFADNPHKQKSIEANIEEVRDAIKSLNGEIR